jgi:hypothetical protein
MAEVVLKNFVNRYGATQVIRKATPRAVFLS